MKPIRYICSILCLIYFFSLFPMYVLATSTEQETVQVPVEVGNNSCRGFDATIAMLGADLGIKNMTSAFLYEVKSDTSMYAMNADQMLSPSSLVKIMTALIAIERGNPDTSITVREDVLSTVPYDAVSADLLTDEIITLRDLLYCMMVGSANDAAAVIADHISGSQEAFVQVMNDYAKTLGCTATNFTNVHGLHDEAQYTTARDMARILSAAVKNEAFNAYFSTVHYTVPVTNKSEERYLSSNNSLMNSDDTQIYYDERVTGGRTGTTEEGTRCLAVSAQSNEMQLICVIMGSESQYDENSHKVTLIGGFKEASALLDAGFNGFKMVQILFPNQTIRQQTVLNGDSDVVLGAKSAAYTILPISVASNALNYRYIDNDKIEAPIQIGDTLSKVQIWNGNVCVAESDLIAMNSVSVISQESSGNDENMTGSNVKTIFITVVVVVLSMGVIVLIVRYISVLRYKIRQKRYRRARRRSR